MNFITTGFKLVVAAIVIAFVALPIYTITRQLKFEREAVKVINEHAAAIDDHAKSLRITAYLLNGGTNRQGERIQWRDTNTFIPTVINAPQLSEAQRNDLFNMRFNPNTMIWEKPTNAPTTITVPLATKP